MSRFITVELEWAGNSIKGMAEYEIREDRHGSVDLDVVEVKQIGGTKIPPGVYMYATDMTEHDYDSVLFQIHQYHRELAAEAYDYTREEA